MARNYASPWDLPDPLTQSPGWASWASSLDPFANRFDQTLGQGPDPLYSYGAPLRGGVDFDPLPKGDPYGAPSVEFGYNVTESGIEGWLRNKYPELYAGFGDYGTATNPGVVGSPGGAWAPVDAWNSQVLAAVKQVQSETGVYVPPNVVKALMRIESGGDPNAGPAYGLLQVTSGAMGQYDLARARSDPAYGLYAGVKDLALRYQDAQKINPGYGWSNVAVGYFSGHYEPNGAADSLGTTDFDYQKAFNQYWTELTKAGGQGGAAAAGTTQVSAIWGGFDAPVSQEYGWTDFAQNSDYAKTAYAYTAAYTRDRQPMGHAGIDVGLSYGSALFAPVAGTVAIAGGTGYYCDVDGNGCGPGVGQLELQLANGDRLILGHMSQITLKVGDSVAPGQFVGYSGSENGGHVHVEYRRWVGEGVTDSGYEVVDPRLALAGVFTGTYGQAGSGPALAASATDWASFMKNAATGLPLTGRTPRTGGFHDWLLGQMNVGVAPVVESPTSDAPSGWYWSNTGVPTPTGAAGQPR